MLILLLFQVSVGTLAIAAPEIGTTVLGFDFLDLGIKLILPIFFGSVLGAFFVDRYMKGHRKVLISFGMFGAGSVLLTMGFLGLKGIVYYPLIMFLLFILGFMAIVVMITGTTVVQEETPVEIMGRVSGAYKLFQSIIILAPTLMAGAVIDQVGVFPVIFGLVTMIFMIAFLGILKRNHNFRKVEVKDV